MLANSDKAMLKMVVTALHLDFRFQEGYRGVLFGDHDLSAVYFVLCVCVCFDSVFVYQGLPRWSMALVLGGFYLKVLASFDSIFMAFQ